ncbi:MAG: response regulator, partial [Thermoguttaceae bacterium]|nr:response regulator [Thermoguttaceae bacterium]
MDNELVLVIEDEDDIRELVCYNLSKEGYRVVAVSTGEEGIAAAEARRPHAVLLDLMLPGVDGLTVCRRIRSSSRTERIPIIILTAKGEEADIVSGLNLGADDYITKPFSPRVLVARLRAVLRRRLADAEPEDGDSPLERHSLTIHPGRHEVSVDGQPIELTSTEFRVL